MIDHHAPEYLGTLSADELMPACEQPSSEQQSIRRAAALIVNGDLARRAGIRDRYAAPWTSQGFSSARGATRG
jgi:hypothetical protein